MFDRCQKTGVYIQKRGTGKYNFDSCLVLILLPFCCVFVEINQLHSSRKNCNLAVDQDEIKVKGFKSSISTCVFI